MSPTKLQSGIAPIDYLLMGQVAENGIPAPLRKEFSDAIAQMSWEDLVKFAIAQNSLLRMTDNKLKQAEKLAKTDALTKIPNFTGLQEILLWRMALIERYKGTSNVKNDVIAFIDLDGFKNLNDALGHETGNHALQQVAKSFTEEFRDTDIITRYGGDEFVLVLHYEGNENFNKTEIRRKIRDSLKGLVYWKEGEPYPIGASIGFAELNVENLEAAKTNVMHEKGKNFLNTGDDNDVIANLLRIADANMYVDKAGKLERLNVLKRLAIHDNYQPVIIAPPDYDVA